MRQLVMGLAVVVGLLSASMGFPAVSTLAQMQTPSQMPGAMERNLTPPVEGLYKGKKVLFIHTEASDPQVAAMLTQMMGPKVLVVPSLAKIPQDLLGDVYVFTNGVKGSGPFGFQVDVFDAVPGDARYTPLRRVNLVTWKDGARPGVLDSVEQILAAARKGELTVRRSGVVVNMPMIVWPGGQR